ncbi:aldo/keto reductase [Anoxybacillus ayderensis]|uniref:aldo/keto reductase n=1 Tax=unclassified Anoxybacillus TaxID=2639704 RepID=UPI0002FF4692|nr:MULTISPECIES: aldo/keto reductase [unclassified Anoxybacillus]AXM89537.1 aldo/keto reductase [Anoxybacillus ayderensis G10]MBW9217672.1 aldo/keto reductase [Anoxybacillus sp. ST70]NNU95771.1 aldo/keto reductase [Anoxybacillus sp. EFIL]THD16670.1 aldo/keto reductase [Anoxybacillus ayderensis]
MNYRRLGNTELEVSEVSFGTWVIGGSWGQTDDSEALKGLQRAIDAGVNFFDTADVYGDGHSEELLAKATKGKEDDIYIATKFCRAGDIHDFRTYSEENVRKYCEGSLKRLQRERIDLYQIHCPPFEVLKDGRVFEVLDKLQQEGKIRYYGVSVETVEEGLFCLTNPNVKALQVIFNIFRQKPLEQLLPQAKAQGVGILARLPLASGLLTGKFKKDTTFAENDHRHFNRDGQHFNVGETFAGLEFHKGVELSEQLAWIADGRGNMTRAALRWILDHDSVTCVIPGFKTVQQVEDNLQALNVPSFSEEEKERLTEFYKNEIHPFIRGAY